jgi:hypothetical protein
MDTSVATAQLLKKAVMLPTQAVANNKVDLKNPRSKSQPFTRGIMAFDDFNYAAFNDHIFQEDPRNREQILLEIESRLKLP